MKNSYVGADGLKMALNDITNDIVNSKRKRTKSLTNEYVNNTTDLGNKIVPYKDGFLVKDIIAKTNYEIGLVQTNKDYAAKVNEHNISGEEDYLEYEMDNNKQYYTDVYTKLLEDQL